MRFEGCQKINIFRLFLSSTDRMSGARKVVEEDAATGAALTIKEALPEGRTELLDPALPGFKLGRPGT